MQGLVDGKFFAVWQADCGQQAPALIGDIARHLYSFTAQFSERGMDVVTHQVKLVAAVAVSRMHSQFGGRQGENKPAATRVTDGRPSTSAKNALPSPRAGRRRSRVCR